MYAKTLGFEAAFSVSAMLLVYYVTGEKTDQVDGMTIESAHMLAARFNQNTAKVHFN